MKRRGQVTIFIILAILVISVVALFFTLGGTFQKRRGYIPETDSIRNYVQKCFEQAGQEGIFVVSMQGGFLNPEQNISIQGFNVGYLYYEGENRLPSLTDMGKDISDYVTLNLENCIDDFKPFKEMGFKLKTKEIKTNTLIDDDSVNITIDFPIRVEKAGSRSNIESEYSEIYPVKLKKYYVVAKNIVEMEVRDPLSIDAIFLLNQNLNIDFTNYGEKTIVYALEDNESKINDRQYLFVFANKLE